MLTLTEINLCKTKSISEPLQNKKFKKILENQLNILLQSMENVETWFVEKLVHENLASNKNLKPKDLFTKWMYAVRKHDCSQNCQLIKLQTIYWFLQTNTL